MLQNSFDSLLATKSNFESNETIDLSSYQRPYLLMRKLLEFFQDGEKRYNNLRYSENVWIHVFQ